MVISLKGHRFYNEKYISARTFLAYAVTQGKRQIFFIFYSDCESNDSLFHDNPNKPATACAQCGGQTQDTDINILILGIGDTADFF